MRVRLTNIGRGARGMYDINHVPFEVRPGEARNVDLHESDIEHLRDMEKRARLQNSREPLQVDDADPELEPKAEEVIDASKNEKTDEVVVDGTKPATTHVDNLTERVESNLTDGEGDNGRAAAANAAKKNAGGRRG